MAWIVVALLGSAFLFMPGLLEQFETPKIEIVRLCGLAALAASLIAGRAGQPRRWSMLDRAVERMAALAPVNALLLVEGARLEQAIGHVEDARRLGERVVALYPMDGDAHLVIAEASRALGDTLAAAEALRRAAAAAPRLVAPTGGH